MSEDVIEHTELDLALPPEFDRAPAWARSLAHQQRRDRHHSRGEMMKLQGDIHQLDKKMGDEPDADGKGGRGLIGDVRRMNRDLGQLMDLKKMGIGAVGAIVLFGTLIIAGIIHFVQSIGHPK